ncbi:MAG: hypothetical protein ACUVQ9_11430 [Thermodesulfobacteriota bacterium]
MVIFPGRGWRIEPSFGWVNNLFITSSFLKELTFLEILLYFFLAVGSYRNGVSFLS